MKDHAVRRYSFELCTRLSCYPGVCEPDLDTVCMYFQFGIASLAPGTFVETGVLGLPDIVEMILYNPNLIQISNREVVIHLGDIPI